MWSTAREVAAGDTVIIWLTRDLVQPLVVTPGKDFNTRYGNFKHSDFVGVPYGSKVVPKSGKGFIHILKPTPELWTIALPHRTQILYLADIALITSYLGIRKGSKVIEAGMSLSLWMSAAQLTKRLTQKSKTNFSYSHTSVGAFRTVSPIDRMPCFCSLQLTFPWKAPDRHPSLIRLPGPLARLGISGLTNFTKRDSIKQSQDGSILLS